MKTKFLIFAIILFAGFPTATAQTKLSPMKFDFGSGAASKGYTQVSAKDFYNREKGFGFEPGASVNCIDRTSKNALQTDFCTSDKPFYFSVAVPEGNYKVTVTFGDAKEATVTTVKAELRRLMLEKVETKAGEFIKKSFVVNVRTPQISGAGGEVKLKDRERTTEWWAWDEKLTLEFNNSRPTIAAIEIEPVDVPTIFLIGDSTVCDQPREPYASWGQMLTGFFAPSAAIANHAESGESLKSSLGARRLDKVLSLMKPGDYLLIQYAHNDEKEKGEGIGAFTTYKASLKEFVEGTRRKGGTPILITPMHRRTFDAATGKIINSHGDYPEAVRQAAIEEKVLLIDLTTMSKDFYEALGKEKSGAAFKEGDGTHHNNYGSYELAKSIVGWIKSNRFDIAKFLIKDLPPFDPSKPDAPEKFSIPASPMISDVKPLGS
jgi:lysophospholipase L1-like esterase